MKRRRSYRPRRTALTQAKTENAPRVRQRSATVPPPSLNLVRTIVCGTAFSALVALKLLVPGNLSAARGTLREWLTHDADFAAAFSSVGHAVSGEGGVLDALEEAYIAVFGKKEEATEVNAAADITADAAAGTEEKENVLPESDAAPHAVWERRQLSFAYAPPLSGEITSPFGWREHPNTGREAFHYGVDIAADEGEDVRCFADGTVGVVGESVELGKYLTVHHADGIITLYGHCSGISVQSGAAVRKGEKLAQVGSTGNATGPHLHFEIHDGEDYLDPVYYLS